MIAALATGFIGGVGLGEICRQAVNRYIHFYESEKRLAFGWPSFIGGMVALSLAWRFGISPLAWVYAGFLCMLGIAAGIDTLSYVLPDILTMGGMLVAFPVAICFLDLSWGSVLAGGVAGVVLLTGFYAMTLYKDGRPGIGLGDVKLMGFLGVLCGIHALPQILVVSCMASWPLVLISKSKRIPFGPSLCLGAWSWIVLPYSLSSVFFYITC